jgi:glycolate oxidase
MSKVPDVLTGIYVIIGNYYLPFVVFGHAGDGNMDPVIMYDRSETGQTSHIGRTADEIFKLACSMDRTLSGKHGIGVTKAPFMTLEHDTAGMSVMNRLKIMLHPNHILNPGKMGLET